MVNRCWELGSSVPRVLLSLSSMHAPPSLPQPQLGLEGARGAWFGRPWQHPHSNFRLGRWGPSKACFWGDTANAPRTGHPVS